MTEVFTKLRAMREFQKVNLPHLLTIVDFDVVLEVGYHQEIGQTLAWSHLILLNLGSPATVSRRTARLCKLGVLEKKPSEQDGRVVFITLSAETSRVYHDYGRDVLRFAAMESHPRPIDFVLRSAR